MAILPVSSGQSPRKAAIEDTLTRKTASTNGGQICCFTTFVGNTLATQILHFIFCMQDYSSYFGSYCR